MNLATSAAATLRQHPGAQERALVWVCEGESVLGVLSEPLGAPSSALGDLGLVVIVGGPQYRAGAHRLFVQLCRDLAAQGITCLRFDVRGMGDSTGAQRSFEALSADIGAAVDALTQAAPYIRRVVLWGLCDGASAALLYSQEQSDARIAGLCLANPWVRSEASLAKAHVKHYYLDRIRQPEFWRKLARGQVAGAAARELWGNLRRAAAAHPAVAEREPHAHPGEHASQPFQARMAYGLKRFKGPVQILLSGQDYTAREFEEHTAADTTWKALLKAGRVHKQRLPQADHTVSTHEHKALLSTGVSAWLGRELFQGNKSC